jgi:hypothetical protein
LLGSSSRVTTVFGGGVAGEVGAAFGGANVADDGERRVVEVVAALALGAAGGDADDLDRLLEGVVGAGEVGGRGGGVADEAAQVDEVLVRRRAFRQLRPRPLLDEACYRRGIGRG